MNSKGGDFPDEIHPPPSRETFTSMDQAPLPPEMIAALFKDDPEMIAALFLKDDIVPRDSRGQIDEELGGGDEDDEAPLPPKVILRTESTHYQGGNNISLALNMGRSRETNTEDRPHYTAIANVRSGTSPIAATASSSTSPIATTLRGDNDASFVASRVETSIGTTVEETMLQQPSLPILEATLVEEEPARERETVHEAIPLEHTWLSSKCKQGVTLVTVLVATAAIVTVVVVTTTNNKAPMAMASTVSSSEILTV